MQKAKWICAALLVVAASMLASAQNDKRTVSQVLDHAITNVEGEFVPAADAMPEDKYGFAPSNGEFKGVRTFAQQVKHVATVNYMVSASIIAKSLRLSLAAKTVPTISSPRPTS